MIGWEEKFTIDVFPRNLKIIDSRMNMRGLDNISLER